MYRKVLLLILVLPIVLFGKTHTFTIQTDDLTYNRNTNNFSFEDNSGWIYTSAPGAYRLPQKTVNIILPPNAVNIIPTFSASDRSMADSQAPAITSAFYDGKHIITSENIKQPVEHVHYQGTGKWGDILYARFTINPVLYENGLYRITDNVYLNIGYSLTNDVKSGEKLISPSFKPDNSFLNPEDLSAWYTPSQRNYDYLVVTTPELYTGAASLITMHQNQGMLTAFADIDTILATSLGANPAEKLRNYLITEYNDSPFSYLLLIGDIDLVPIAYLTPEPNGNETVPSDFYFSDLSSSFDSDNDSKLGEFDSGMDYTPELAVGRIPLNDAASVSQVCNRIVNFEAGDFLWKRKTLLPAAMLNYADEVQDVGWERTDGATFMEYAKYSVLRNHFNTTLYEQEGILPSYISDYPLNADTLFYLLNTQSYGIVNWSAHGSPILSARKMWNEDTNENNTPDPGEMGWSTLISVDTFNNVLNPDGAVFFCASCYNGMIDNDVMSLGETLIKKKAVADIAATRTGWYKLGWANPGWGGLTSYNYHFLENYAQAHMTVGQAHAYANWMHTQYCFFGDPIDSGGIIWPELQNIYTYMLYGDPAIGYPAQNTAPTHSILIWEPSGNTGNTVLNGLHELGALNVVYTDHLIDTYNYLNQFDAVFCLFGLGYGQNNYQLLPGSFEYGYLLSYLQQGGKVYMEGMVNWDSADSLFGRFGTIAPFDHIAMIEQIKYTTNGIDHIWDYNGYNGGTQALWTSGTTSLPLFYSHNTNFVNDVIGIWNRIGDSRTISSSFNLSGVYSDINDYPEFLSVILDTLGVTNSGSVSALDDVDSPALHNIALGPNPFRNHLIISAKSEKPLTLSIYNIKGQLVKTEKLLPKSGNVNWMWDAKDTHNKELSAGIYLMKLNDGRRNIVKKTLKLN